MIAAVVGFAGLESAKIGCKIFRRSYLDERRLLDSRVWAFRSVLLFLDSRLFLKAY